MPTNNSSPDVIVIGGGVIGLAIGWRALRRGLAVTLVERGEPGAGTSRVAAGMIAPVAEAALAEQRLLALSLASARAYPAFVAELRDESGIDPAYLPCGTLMVARDTDEAAVLGRELELRQRLGLAVRRVTPTEARRLEPALAPTLRGALEFPDDRAIDPRALTRALVVAFTRAGGRLVTGEAARLLRSNETVTGVELNDGTRIEAGATVLAAGPWSGELAGLPDEVRIPLRPVKGQILGLRDPSGPGMLQRVVRMQPGYLVPRGDGRYALGASVEERGFDTTVTAGPVFELLRDAIELVPGLSELVIEELNAGTRPGTADNMPALGPGALAGLHWAVGHYRHGILLTPVTAEIVVAALCGEPPSELAQSASPERLTAPVVHA
ncbi:MAG TPA: glycine oxidase ThiO [Solirubrobacteraceae bacterium]|nr:glycine oxidase ThiO [Solirubrobacteraceae bacterium]